MESAYGCTYPVLTGPIYSVPFGCRISLLYRGFDSWGLLGSLNPPLAWNCISFYGHYLISTLCKSDISRCKILEMNLITISG